MRRGRFYEASLILEQAIKREGPSFEGYLGLAKAHDHMMNYKLGLAYCDKALTLHPSMASVWAERAVAHLGLEDYRAALGDAEEALSIDAKNGQALNIQQQAKIALADKP